MPRILRYCLIISMTLIIVVVVAIFGRFPSSGIPDDTVRISVSRNTSDSPIFSLTAADELQALKESAGTIWHGIGYNSLDGPDQYWMTLTKRDGHSQSFWITPTEWSDHGKAPKGFFELLSKMGTEQVGTSNGG
jgi:hypothetical protein